MDFGFGGGGGGGGGGAHGYNVSGLMCLRGKKKSDIGQNYPIPKTCSMLRCNFLWGLRNWLHNKAERGGP